MPSRICIKPNCDRPLYAKGMCKRHYSKAREAMAPTRTCSVGGCDDWHSAKGYCRTHYLRLHRGSPIDGIPTDTRTPYEKVMAQAERRGACLIFTGGESGGGYGVVYTGGGRKARNSVLAHRIVMAHHNGPPVGTATFVLHSCDTPACVEITHLRYGTQSDNMTDAARRGRLGGFASMLNPDKVRSIKRDPRPQREIAAEYDISIASVSGVKNGRTWAWVT